MQGHIDRKISGVKVGIEVKVTQRSGEWDQKANIFPAEHYLQCLHYLAVTGYESWVLLVLILKGSNSEILTFTINPAGNVILSS